MACAQTGSLLDHFSVLRDPRQGGKVLYPLPEILLLVLCATLACANDFVATRLWGERALPFLRRFLPYDDGLPSHDTLSDVMNALDPELFKQCFLGWVETLRSSPTEADGPEIIAVDGKTSRRTHNRAKGREPPHLVSAWACGQRLVLGQEATADKSNEITAIPRLLERLGSGRRSRDHRRHGHADRDRPHHPPQGRGLVRRRPQRRGLRPSRARWRRPCPPPGSPPDGHHDCRGV